MISPQRMKFIPPRVKFTPTGVKFILIGVKFIPTGEKFTPPRVKFIPLGVKIVLNSIYHQNMPQKRVWIMKQFISVNDLITPSQPNIGAAINDLAKKALAYKANPIIDKALGANKRIGLLFLNPSLRTRLSTQVAAQNLGMEAIVFNVDKEGWALEFEEGAIMSGTTVEHIKDAAPIMGLYFDILAIRTFPSLQNRTDDYSEMYVNQFIKYAGVPVVSLECYVASSAIFHGYYHDSGRFVG